MKEFSQQLVSTNLNLNQVLLEEVLLGFSRGQKSIPPKFLYDQRGSEIFERICKLKEYYPTRAENEILREHGREMAAFLGPQALILEPGSGSGEKIRHLIPYLERPSGYLPVEISAEILERMSNEIKSLYPELPLFPECRDFYDYLSSPIVFDHHPENKAVFFPGSTIGNCTPGEATDLMQKFYQVMHGQGHLLIGVDLKKDPVVLQQAYDDAQGVTAQFNLNLLERLNREAAANFNPDNFYHEAIYNEKHGRVEMHLRSKLLQRVRVNHATFEFRPGESIHTENSYKYTTSEFIELAARTNFEIIKYWKDASELFAVYLFEAIQR
jgi:dimethylhistidine N-methyltransferase